MDTWQSVRSPRVQMQSEALAAVDRVKSVLEQMHNDSAQALKVHIETSLSVHKMMTSLDACGQALNGILLQVQHEQLCEVLQSIMTREFELIRRYAMTCTPQEDALLEGFVPLTQSVDKVERIIQILRSSGINHQESEQALEAVKQDAYALQKRVVTWVLSLSAADNQLVSDARVQLVQRVEHFNAYMLPCIRTNATRTQDPRKAENLLSRLSPLDIQGLLGLEQQLRSFVANN